MTWQPQPMDTAPRDRPFLGKVGDDWLRMLWHPEFEAFVSSWREMVMAPGYLIDGKPRKLHSPEIHEPEAWTELPAPPAAEE